MTARHLPENEIYIEVLDAGASLKISAACSRTLEEVSFNAPKNTPQIQLERLAIQKLNYVIRKKKKQR